MGPNSIGTINPAAGLATSIVALEPIDPGGVSLFGQSGVFSAGWARWISESRPLAVWSRNTRASRLSVSHLGGTRDEEEHLHQGFSRLHIPRYPSPERALRAFRALYEYSQFRKR